MFSRLFSWLNRRGVKPAIVIGFALFGTLSISYETFITYTNTLEFCVSCHEMSHTVYEEYKESLHYSNVNGVRVQCPECHVPRNYPDRFFAKIAASKDLLFHFVGNIDTPEKFKANRLRMAQKVWKYMEETDSRECRNCHQYDAMVIEEQGRKARRNHPKAIEEGQTCIDCHKGVVHELPEGYTNKS